MPEIDPVILQLRADVGRYEATLQQTTRKVDALLGQQEGSVRRLDSVVSKSMSSITSAFAGVSAIALARQFLTFADTAKTLDAQLRLATAGFGSFGKAQEDVRRIAASTRSGLEETASLYGNFSRGAKELGADQEAAARATETFSKTLKISGADANESASATLQFGQALAAGALRGDELNSILEASPRLARLLADAFGISIGQLKALGEQGKLTSDRLLDALTNKKYTASIDAEFAQLPVTFDQAMTSITNAAIITFGAFDRGGQFSTALANFVTDGSDGFKDLEQSAVNFGITARSEIEGLASAFAPVLEAGQHLFEALGSGFKGLDLSRDIDKSLGQIDKLTAKLAGNEGFLEQYINTKLYGKPATGTTFQADRRKTQQESELRLRRQNGLTPASRILGKLSDAAQSTGRSPAPRTAPAAAPAKKGPRGPSAEALANKAEREREKAIRDDASKAREAAQLQDDITTAKAALAVATRDILAFNQDQIQSEKNQRIAEYETQLKLGNLTKQEFSDRKAAVEQIADLQNQRVQQIAQENERRDALDVAQGANQNQQDLYRAQADLTESRQERYAIELRLVQLAYDQERAELEGVLASQTSTQAQKDIAAARLRILGQLQDSAERSVDRQNEGPLARYRRDLSSPDRRNDQVEGAVIDELEGLRDSISSAVQKTLGIKNPILEALINSFIEQQIIRPFLDQLSGAQTGGGNLLKTVIDFGKSFFGGARANGGPVQSDKTYLVGERGPELFRPSGSGAITPNHELVGAAARGMVRANAASPASNPIQQTVNNYYGPGADKFWGEVEGRAARIARPIATKQANQAAGASYAAGQQSAPSTSYKYSQLKG